MGGFSKFKEYVTSVLNRSGVNLVDSEECIGSYLNHDHRMSSWPCAEAEGRFFADKKSGELAELGPFVIKKTGLRLALCTETTTFGDWVALRGIMYLPREPETFKYAESRTNTFTSIEELLWQPTRQFNNTTNFTPTSGYSRGLDDAIDYLRTS